jgi:hypothetical protein
MNWLTKYRADISCDKRTVELVSSSGEEVVAELILSEPRNGSCHSMYVDSKKANPLEVMRVVSKLPDVFPEELPSMPPERKVEFALDLIPGTTPISKRTYRVSEPELVELKRHIDELLEKGYIRPSTLPWVANSSVVRRKEGWYQKDVHRLPSLE